MKAEVILSELDRMRDIIEAHTDSHGELPLDSVRVGIILEFCRTQIEKMLSSAENEQKKMD